jgi:hypothetical protein
MTRRVAKGARNARRAHAGTPVETRGLRFAPPTLRKEVTP